jgi:hypothetical protein
MTSTREQLADLFERVRKRQCLGFNSSLADEAIAIVHHEFVEVCCAGAVVDRLWWHQGYTLHRGAKDPQLGPPIPIAQTIEPLAGEVAEWLLTQCHACGHRADCIAGHINDPTGCEEIEPPTFAASYYDAGGVRTYVLASGECQACAGSGDTGKRPARSALARRGHAEAGEV